MSISEFSADHLQKVKLESEDLRSLLDEPEDRLHDDDPLDEYLQRDCNRSSSNVSTARSNNAVPSEFGTCDLVDGAEFVLFSGAEEPKLDLTQVKEVNLSSDSLKKLIPDSAAIIEKNKLHAAIINADSGKQFVLMSDGPFDIEINKGGCNKLSFDKTVVATAIVEPNGDIKCSVKGIRAEVESEFGKITVNIESVKLKPGSADIEITSNWGGIPVGTRKITLDKPVPEVAQLQNLLTEGPKEGGKEIPQEIRNRAKEAEDSTSTLEYVAYALAGIVGVEAARRLAKQLLPSSPSNRIEAASNDLQTEPPAESINGKPTEAQRVSQQAERLREIDRILALDGASKPAQLKNARKLVDDYLRNIGERDKTQGTSENSVARKAVDWFLANKLINTLQVPRSLGDSYFEAGEWSKEQFNEAKLRSQGMAPDQEAKTKSVDKQSDHIDQTLDRAEALAKEGNAAGIVELLKNEPDRNLCRVIIEDYLHPLDPNRDFLKQLVSSNTKAGLVALDIGLNSCPEEVRENLRQRYADGSLVEAVINREFNPNNLRHLNLPGQEVMDRLMRGALPPRTVQICRAILEPVNIDSKRTFHDLQDAAIKEIKKLPLATAKSELFDLAVTGNKLAARAWNDIVRDDPNYKPADRTARPIPPDAILDFHKKAKELAGNYGLTDLEMEEYHKVSKEAKAVSAELRQVPAIRDALREYDRNHPDVGRLPSIVLMGSGQFIPPPELVRQHLADNPELLRRYDDVLGRFNIVDKAVGNESKLRAELEVEIFKMVRKAGLPAPTAFHFRHLSNALGRYSSDGTILADHGYMKSSVLGSAEFVNTIVHEIGHLEQDFLRLRCLFTEHGVTKNEPISNEQREKIIESYKVRHGSSPSPEFLDRAWDAWDGTPASEAEKLRAQRLAVSSSMSAIEDVEVGRLRDRGRVLGEFASRANGIANLDNVEKLWAKHGFEKTRARIIEYCGSDVDPKPLLDNLDKMKAATESSMFIKKEVESARAEFAQAAAKASYALEAKGHAKYMEKFEEQATYAAGADAEKIVLEYQATTFAEELESRFSKEGSKYFSDVVSKLSPAAKQGILKGEGFNQDVRLELSEALDAVPDSATKAQIEKIFQLDNYSDANKNEVEKINSILAEHIKAEKLKADATAQASPAKDSAKISSPSQQELEPSGPKDSKAVTFKTPGLHDKVGRKEAIKILELPGGYSGLVAVNMNDVVELFSEDKIAKKIQLMEKLIEQTADEKRRAELQETLDEVKKLRAEFAAAPDKSSFVKELIEKSGAERQGSEPTKQSIFKGKAPTIGGAAAIVIVLGWAVEEGKPVRVQPYKPVVPSK